MAKRIRNSNAVMLKSQYDAVPLFEALRLVPKNKLLIDVKRASDLVDRLMLIATGTVVGFAEVDKPLGAQITFHTFTLEIPKEYQDVTNKAILFDPGQYTLEKLGEGVIAKGAEPKLIVLPRMKGQYKPDPETGMPTITLSEKGDWPSLYLDIDAGAYAGPVVCGSAPAVTGFGAWGTTIFLHVFHSEGFGATVVVPKRQKVPSK